MIANTPPWVGRALVIAVLVALAVIAAWQTHRLEPNVSAARQSQPQRIMGTSCRLVAVPPADATRSEATAIAGTALEDAEAALRRVEAQMSTWIDASPLSRFNRAPGGELVPLPQPVVDVLQRSRELHRTTGGAFDVTCGPLVQLWRAAGKSGHAPSPSDIESARHTSSWQKLELRPDGALKRGDSVRVDVGGIAKGYGIDQAVAAMQKAGAGGGLVDVGGDVRVFGTQPQGERWPVYVRHPSGEGTVATLELRSGAVCTSGDYFRFVEVDGERHSHIIDPRSGHPARGIRSATVVASDALTADAWATALSVLGEPGLDRLPAGVEALIILGDHQSLHAIATKNLHPLLTTPLPFPTTHQ